MSHALYRGFQQSAEKGAYCTHIATCWTCPFRLTRSVPHLGTFVIDTLGRARSKCNPRTTCALNATGISPTTMLEVIGDRDTWQLRMELGGFEPANKWEESQSP